MGKLFTPTVPSVAEGQLNQQTPGIAGTFVTTLGKLFTCMPTHREENNYNYMRKMSLY